MIEQIPAIIIVTPLVSSFAIFISSWWHRKPAYPVALAALSICCLSSVAILRSVINLGVMNYCLGGWEPPWGIQYRIDHLNALMLVLISFLGLITAIYAKRSIEKELPNKATLFWCIYLLMFTGLLGITITGDTFNMFVLIEVASLAGYTLVAIGSGQGSIAGFRYLIIGTIGASFYLLGIGYLYINTGSLNMEDLRMLLQPLYASRTVRAAFVFIFIGFAIKIALFPLHAWQPDAYTYAPSAVTVIISTAAAKTFTYALIRIIFSVFTIDFIKGILPVFNIICWVATLAMLIGSIYAVAQHNLKRMLAYSSVANVGYIVLAIGLAPRTSVGLTPAIMHILNHAIMKGCMFMAACGFIHQLDLRDIKDFVGLGRKMPFTCMCLILAALAMIGMPPGAGFITKWYLILASIGAGGYLFVAAIFISTLLMIVYFWRVVEIMYIRVPENGPVDNASIVNELPCDMLLPCLLLGILSFVIGILWVSGLFSPLLDAINSGFQLGGML